MGEEMKISVVECHDTMEIREKVDAIFRENVGLLPVSKSARILIKPNHNSNMNALTGNTSDLRVLAAIIRSLQKIGYRNIAIGEGTSSGFYHNKINAFSRLKTAELTKKFDVEIVDFNYSDFEVVDFGDGLKAKVANECLNADFFISVPKIKMHAEAGMTAALKSIVGCLVGLDKRKIHNKNYFANILKLNEKIKPDFYIVDGLIAMEGNGPSAGTPVKMDLILAGSDPMLMDLAIAKLIGYGYDEVPYLKLAKELGKISNDYFEYINRLNLDNVKKSFKRPNPNMFFVVINHPRTFRFFTWLRYSRLLDWFFSLKIVIKILHFLHFTQDLYVDEEAEIVRIIIDKEKCNGCKECAKYCPMGLNLPDQLEANGVCIKCLYCYSVCPKKAIRLEGKLGFFASQIDKYDRVIREMITNDMSTRGFDV
jgi:uncharacterized protein (DUF362 family)/ferredoxin